MTDPMSDARLEEIARLAPSYVWPEHIMELLAEVKRLRAQPTLESLLRALPDQPMMPSQLLRAVAFKAASRPATVQIEERWYKNGRMERKIGNGEWQAAPPLLTPIEAGARALFAIGNKRIGERKWDDVKHYYLEEAAACILAAHEARQVIHAQPITPEQNGAAAERPADDPPTVFPNQSTANNGLLAESERTETSNLKGWAMPKEMRAVRTPE